MSNDPRVVNVDWSMYIKFAQSPALRMVVSPLLSPQRRERIASLPPNVVRGNLTKRLPFVDNSVDAVFHSHVLEHFDKSVAPRFISEILRVLRPGGIHRVVVPDFEAQVAAYIDSCNGLNGPSIPRAELDTHEACIEEILEQSVRRESAATQGRTGMRAAVERLILGDARRRGETHQWMYDRYSLASLLRDSGFVSVMQSRWNASGIPGFAFTGLEVDSSGAEYKPASLYFECRKPS